MAPSLQVRSQQQRDGLESNASAQSSDSRTLNSATRRSWNLLLQCKHWLAATTKILTKSLLASPKLEVWTTRDSQGQTLWHAYDPHSRQVVKGSSESELRVWLESHKQSVPQAEAMFGMSSIGNGYRRDSRVL